MEKTGPHTQDLPGFLIQGGTRQVVKPEDILTINEGWELVLVCTNVYPALSRHLLLFKV